MLLQLVKRLLYMLLFIRFLGVRLNRCKGGRQEYRRRPDERDFSPVKSGPRKKNQHRKKLGICPFKGHQMATHYIAFSPFKSVSF